MTITHHTPQAERLLKPDRFNRGPLVFCTSVFEKAAKSGPRVFKVRVQGELVPRSPRDDAIDTGDRVSAVPLEIDYLTFRWKKTPLLAIEAFYSD